MVLPCHNVSRTPFVARMLALRRLSAPNENISEAGASVLNVRELSVGRDSGVPIALSVSDSGVLDRVVVAESNDMAEETERLRLGVEYTFVHREWLESLSMP